jgi:ribonuclease P protein component
LIECQSQLASDDFVIIARKGVEELPYREIKQNLLHVLKLAKLYQEGTALEKET